MGANYNLFLSTPLGSGKSPIANITAIAEDWTRSIKLQGGYWTGSFTIYGSTDYLRQWFYSYLNCHIEERSPTVTWEGYIDSMEIDDTGEAPYLDVKVNGYIFKAFDRYVPYALVITHINVDITTVVIALVNACDQDYLNTGKMYENSMVIKTTTNTSNTIGSELEKLVAMGDDDSRYYHLWCSAGGRVNYDLIDFEPRYYIYGGARRQRGLGDMYNYLNGKFTNLMGYDYFIDGVNEPGSVAQFGQREKVISQSNIKYEDASQLLAKTLRESAWPYPRVLSISDAAEFVDEGGVNMLQNRWSLQPGIMRDMLGVISTSETRASSDPALLDRRDILVDEVEVSPTEISLVRGGLSEVAMLQAVWDWKRRRGEKRRTRMAYAGGGGMPIPKGSIGTYTSVGQGYMPPWSGVTTHKILKYIPKGAHV